eukprot:gene4111-2957_t
MISFDFMELYFSGVAHGKVRLKAGKQNKNSFFYPLSGTQTLFFFSLLTVSCSLLCWLQRACSGLRMKRFQRFFRS